MVGFVGNGNFVVKWGGVTTTQTDYSQSRRDRPLLQQVQKSQLSKSSFGVLTMCCLSGHRSVAAHLYSHLLVPCWSPLACVAACFAHVWLVATRCYRCLSYLAFVAPSSPANYPARESEYWRSSSAILRCRLGLRWVSVPTLRLRFLPLLAPRFVCRGGLSLNSRS